MERIPGVQGIMDRNVKQHDAFTPAMDVFGQYIRDCWEIDDGLQEWSALRFRELLNPFGEPLAEHLREEIPTLISLGEYDIQAAQ